MEKFTIVNSSIKKSQSCGVESRIIDFKINSIPVNVEPVGWIKGAIEDIVIHSIEGSQPNDMVGFTFGSKSLQRGQGFMPFKKASEIKFSDIWSMIFSIYQSNSTDVSTDTFELTATIAHPQPGKSNFKEECSRKQ